MFLNQVEKKMARSKFGVRDDVHTKSQNKECYENSISTQEHVVF